MILEIEDDGFSEEESDLTGVSYRKVKSIERVKSEGPFYGKPQREIEYTVDANFQPLPLKQTEYIYTQKDQGYEVEQKIYNSQNNFCYAITKKYDERKRLIHESNPLGHITHYKYDHNNNKTHERIVGSGKELIYDYDYADRLIRKTEKHKSGETFITNYHYDTLNQLVGEIDPYGNETTFDYDEFGNQTRCIKPLMHDTQYFVHPTITKKYNILNQVIEEKDENGYTTSYSYNVYGKPTKIIYADGAIEKMMYYECGWLKKKIRADETFTQFTYDPKGRITKESTYDSKGNLFKEEEYGYKGAVLQYKKDGMGLITTYSYDRAGRKIEENCGTKKTCYQYDDFDNIIQIEQGGQLEIYQYDWLSRPVSKSLQDDQGNLYAKETYAYDIFGNEIEKIVWQTPTTFAKYSSHYGTDGKLLWKEDPYQHRSQWEYNHKHINSFNQQVQCRAIIDPLGRYTAEADDVHQRLVQRDIYENGNLVSHLCYHYDARGNLIRQDATVMKDGETIRDYKIVTLYNSRGLVEVEIEMPQNKITTFKYDHMKRLKSKQKADGITINYTYDSLDRLKTKKSSDGTVNYTYSYDVHDNLIQVEDHLNNLVQIRKFDIYNRLIDEDLLPGMHIHYEYDDLDRITQIILPDGTSINYTYDLFHLKKIEYNNTIIDFLEYDLCGRLLNYHTPAGIISSTYDLLGRAVTIQSPHWESHLEQFDPVGNLLKMKQTDPSGTLESTFAYDRFNHVIQESSIHSNQFSYDSLGNCLTKNGKAWQINSLNQVVNDGEIEYKYDANGNLQTQSNPPVYCIYDALNRLIYYDNAGERTYFLYDAFGRCLAITDSTGTKHLIYQGMEEIGSYLNGQRHELRIIHPELPQHTFAIELQGEVFYPTQDFRGNICSLQKRDGSLAQWIRYSAFGSKTIEGSQLANPWKFASKREIGDLSLFIHRFYNFRLMRWQTTDPLGFEDGLNLYAYVHNNPFCYKDPDGLNAIAFQLPKIIIPILEFTFGVALSPLAVPITLGTLATAAVLYSGYQLYDYYQQCIWLKNH